MSSYVVKIQVLNVSLLWLISGRYSTVVAITIIENCFSVFYIIHNFAANASTPRFVKDAILCPCMYIPNCDRQSTCVNALACQKCLIKPHIL